MIDGRSILAVIPARGGSKGVPRKNVRLLAGKPLIAWTIEAALRSQYIDRVVLSSDDQEIIAVARDLGCEVPFVRPAALSGDDAPGIAPVLHALDEISGYDLMVLLQPTSPLRSTEDIDGAIAFCHQRHAPCCVSVSPPGKSPYWMYTLDEFAHLSPLLGNDVIMRRQDLPEALALNGAVYVADCRWLKESRSFITAETVAYRMPAERSFDIDEMIDFEICDALLRRSTSQV